MTFTIVPTRPTEVKVRQVRLRPARPTLEGLPTELLVQILLQIPDLASLKSIVLSSRRCCEVFRAVKQEVLCRIVKRQYGVLLGEAILAVRSRGLSFANHKEEAIALLDTWRRSSEISTLASTASSRIDEPRDLQEILGLLHLDKVWHYFMQDFAMNALRPAWIERGEWENSMLFVELTHTEKHRFLRAFCRLQTHSNIFEGPESNCNIFDRTPGNWWTHREQEASPFDTYEEAYRLFFGTMPPWEYDEMGCVWEYLSTKYEPFYKEILDGLHDLMKDRTYKDYRRDYFEWLPQELQPPWVYLDSPRAAVRKLPYCTPSLAALGPDFLYRLLHTTPLLWRDMVMANADCDQRSFVGDKMTEMWVPADYKLPMMYPADRHAVWDFEQLWSELPTTEKPNIEWKKLRLFPNRPERNLEDVVNLQGQEGCGWDWGYALWDDERLKTWNSPVVQDLPYEVYDSDAETLSPAQ